MRIVVIGASGTIGHQLFADAVSQGLPAIGTYFTRAMPQLARFDIASDRLIGLLPDLSEKDCVYLLSAYINPNWIFENPVLSMDLNIHATLRIIDEVFSRNARVIFVSTELVYNGVRGGYSEDDVPNPTTLYGKQKVEVEKYICSSSNNWCIVRTGSTVSSRPLDNCPVAKTYQTLLAKGAKMASDTMFTLTDVRDTSAILLKLADHPPNKIFHVISAPPLSHIELAEWIIGSSLFGHLMAFDRVLFKAVNYPERRPQYSWLSNKKVVTELGAGFASPKTVVQRKVALLDQWYLRKEGETLK